MPELDVFAILERLDPTLADPPPAANSPRYRSIRATATATSAIPSNIEALVATIAIGDAPDRHIPGRRGKMLGVVAAALALAVGVAVVFEPGDEPSPAAAITRAAENLSNVTSLRATITVEYPGDEGGTSTLELNGGDRRITHPAGHACCSSTEIWTVVDGTEYITKDGMTTADPLNPNYDLDPFGDASEAVVRSLLAEADITQVGRERVRDTEATRYRLDVADPNKTGLADLPRATTSWFELWFQDDYWRGAVSIDVWVGDDDLIRRIRISAVEPQQERFTAEYFDFDADIVITPPPGPYTREAQAN